MLTEHMSPNLTLINFEQHLGLGPTTACKVLGIAYRTYANYRAGERVLPGYHEVHIKHIYRFTPRQLAEVIEEALSNGNQ